MRYYYASTYDAAPLDDTSELELLISSKEILKTELKTKKKKIEWD